MKDAWDQPTWVRAQLYADLAGRTDIINALGVERLRMRSWLDRRDQIGIPRPVRRIGHLDVYSLREWRDWYDLWVQNHIAGRSLISRKRPPKEAL